MINTRQREYPLTLSYFRNQFARETINITVHAIKHLAPHDATNNPASTILPLTIKSDASQVH